MKKAILLYLLFAAFSNLLSAQPALRVKTLQFPDTIIFSQSYTVRVTVENNGDTSSVYNGHLTTYCSINGTAPFVLDSIPNVILSYGDTIESVINNFTLPSHAMASGGNVVVVWPTGIAPTQDSAITSTFIIDDTGIRKTKIQPSVFDFFPNPANDKIMIISRGNSTVERVRIFTMEGVLVSDQLNISVLSLENFSPGVYLLEISNGKENEIIKMVKQ